MTKTRLCMLGVLALAMAARANEAFPALFPFLISYDGPDNASSVAHLLDAPAGKHGFVRVENGHFVNDKGRVKLHATNLTGPANFPTHEQADQVAARLARFGINCVRLHYFDAEYGNFMTEKETGIFGKSAEYWTPDSPAGSSDLPKAFSADPARPFRLDPAMLERQDYLIAALKKRGIYVNMNLHVARFQKGRCFIDPVMIAAEKEYARALLTRVNPYTGLAYTDDPCVAMIEINNENSFFRTYHKGAFDGLTGRLADDFRGQWNAWLAKKYASTAALKAAWKWEAAPLGAELIAEGAFDAPVTIDGKTWIVERGSSSVVAEAKNGALTVTVAKDGGEMFPKLYRRVPLKKGQPYTVSFRVRQTAGKGGQTLGFAVAKTQGGWESLGFVAPYEVGKAWKKITRAFYAAETTDVAEIQFTRFKTGAYEIDDLSFRPGAESAFNDPGRLEDGAVPIVKNLDFAPLEARTDFYRFLFDTERAYWTDLSAFVKGELKAKAPISGTQLGYSSPLLQAELDYVDDHSYWLHPSVNNNWSMGNTPMVNSMSCILGIAGNRVAGKPFTVSEYNHPFPNQYGAEGQPMLRAYGALQGWDGVFEYTYNHSPDFEPRRTTYFFSMIARTEVLAHFPACAAMYLRGDVREAQGTVTGTMDAATYFDRFVKSHSAGVGIGSVGLDAKLALVHKTGMAFPKAPGGGTPDAEKADGAVIASDTGELVWNRELPGKAYWTVNTPNTKLFSGFPEGREIALGGVKLALGPTRLGWATVSLTSRRATGFGEGQAPATILLTATGLTENEGTILEKVGDGSSVAFRDRLNWGSGTVLTEGVPAAVTLPSAPARTKAFALDERGERKAEVPVEKAGSGSKIAIGPQYQTVWYEIEAR